MENKNKIRLRLLGLPLVQTINDLSNLIHISEYTVVQLSKHSDKYYKTYKIPKKSGGERLISQPSRKLKSLQVWVLVNILNKLKVSKSCKGFEKGSSTLDNVQPHKNANCVLTMDLEDFFGTVTSKQIYNVFKSIGYNKLISTVLTNICVYNGSLPQGSPCSPRLANLVTWKLDVRIQGYAGMRGLTYTRYADDLTFSGLHPSKVGKIVPMIKTIINDENFKVNERKTRIAGASRAKIVTGLTISENKIGIGKRKYRKLRAKIHHLFSPDEHKNILLLNEINGWLSYLNSVDKIRLKKIKKYIKHLNELNPDTLVSKIAIGND